jgi:hypothetical protein
MSLLKFVCLKILKSTDKREPAILIDVFNVLPKQNVWFKNEISRFKKVQHVPHETRHDYRLMTYRFTTETIETTGCARTDGYSFLLCEINAMCL